MATHTMDIIAMAITASRSNNSGSLNGNTKPSPLPILARVQSGRRQFVEVLGRIFDAPITAWSVTAMFHLLSRLSGVRDADYFYDRDRKSTRLNSSHSSIS